MGVMGLSGLWLLALPSKKCKWQQQTNIFSGHSLSLGTDLPSKPQHSNVSYPPGTGKLNKFPQADKKSR